MIRHLTDEEVELMDRLHGDETLDEEEIKNRLIEIDKEETKDWPFAH